MSIAAKMTLFPTDRAVTFACRICGTQQCETDGLDFGLNELSGMEQNLVCGDCAKYLRPDLIMIKEAVFKFAVRGGWPCYGLWKSVETSAAATPRAIENARSYQIECEDVATELIFTEIKKQRNQRDEELAKGISDENRPGMPLADIQKLEFYYAAYFENRFGDLM